MEKLKQRILRDGKALGSDVIKVDSFLNHQIDVRLLAEIGQEIKKRFQDEEITKILTIEASGIAIACAVALQMGDLPVLFAKKTPPNTIESGMYQEEITSFTKRMVFNVVVSKEYLSKDDRVLIVDDFMARGESAQGLANLVKQAGGHVVGIGVAIEKKFQGGADRLREAGYRVESLAVITSTEDGNICFID
ncbi:MAG: xanthine phosphoribosyltransferase [Anaerovoracaceae bacterium]|jgi:xanthine phosphoribosyltransferase